MPQHANVIGSSFRLCVKTMYCKPRFDGIGCDMIRKLLWLAQGHLLVKEGLCKHNGDMQSHPGTEKDKSLLKPEIIGASSLW